MSLWDSVKQFTSDTASTTTKVWSNSNLAGKATLVALGAGIAAVAAGGVVIAAVPSALGAGIATVGVGTGIFLAGAGAATADMIYTEKTGKRLLAKEKPALGIPAANNDQGAERGNTQGNDPTAKLRQIADAVGTMPKYTVSQAGADSKPKPYIGVEQSGSRTIA